jgi:DNA-binding PadR family transcriptional regulator
MDENTELLLLGLLGRQGMHGYELSQFLEHRLSFLSDLKKPTAYRLLDRLHGSGLVARTAEKAGRRPERGVYSLTAAGEARLDGLLRRHLARSEPTRFASNVALLFSDRLDPAARVSLLAARREAASHRRADLAAQVAVHTPGTSPRLVLEHDLALLDAELAWLDAQIAPRAPTPT